MGALGRLFEQLNLLGYFLIFAGLFSLAGAGLDQDWFMEDWKVRFLSRFLGKRVTRGFYVLLGLALLFLGVREVFGLL